MVSHNPVNIGGHRYSASGDVFSLSHCFERQRVQRAMWLYGWEPLIVSHHLAKFGGHRHYGKGDLMFLVVEKEDSRCSLFNTSLLIISKGHSMKVYNLSY